MVLIGMAQQTKTIKGMMKIPMLVLAGIGILSIFPALRGDAVFDNSQPALIDDEEFYEDTNIPVAIGPKPRFLPPRIQGVYYSGDEYVFKIYEEYCRKWRVKNGYAPPRWHADRKKEHDKAH